MKNVYIIGDSTASNKPEEVYPETGWGQVLNQFIDSSYTVCNHAMNGRSSKSFFEEGLFKTVDEEMSEGDILVICFGHNDQKKDEARGTDPWTTYRQYLMKYIHAARNKGVKPIFVTSVSRRYFTDGKLQSEQEIHGEYPTSMRQLAVEEQVDLIDLCDSSWKLLKELGDNQSKKLYLQFLPGQYDNYPEGINDNTHLTVKGAKTYAEMVAKGLNGLI